MSIIRKKIPCAIVFKKKFSLLRDFSYNKSKMLWERGEKNGTASTMFR